MRGGMYAWMGRWGKRVTEYKPGGGGAGGDVSIAVLIGTSCCEMLTCCLNSPGVPAHAPCSVCCFVCVCVCVDACACVIIFRDSVTDNPLHLSTYAFSSLTNPWAKLQAVYLCISLTGQPDSPSLSNTRMHAHGDSIIRTQPTNNAICVGNPYVTFLTVREAWDDSTRNTCRIPPPLCFTTYTKRLRVTDRSATLAVRGKKALRGGQGSRQVVFVPIEHTTLCATRPFYFSIRQSYRIQTFKKDLGR